MKIKPTFLDVYRRCEKTGNLPDGHGLCSEIPNELLDIFEMFTPTLSDYEKMVKHNINTIYWGSGLKDNHPERHYKFTPLRQTILLLCAAINNEL